MESERVNPSSPNQDNATPSNSPTDHDVDAASLASEFKSLPADYQNVIRSAQHQHDISVVPLQELKGGLTGAVLYLVSVSGPSSAIEHLILKLDRPEIGQPDELDRHKRAHEQAPPSFAREHMAELAFDRVELDGSIAIFYRIAGESLHGYRPFVAFQQQNHVQAIFSVLNREVLSLWNAEAARFDQAVHPQNLLSRWLNERLRPQGNIEKFFEEVRRIDSDKPGLIVQGRVYPNPLPFARKADVWGRARPIDALSGFQHGDMNVNNVLVKFSEDGANLESYYLIDFAFFEERMPLLYDQAYMEMAFLLPYVDTVDFATWVALVTDFASQDIPDTRRVPIELAGAAAAISAGRQEFDNWIRTNHMSLTDDLWGQYWLAATAAGLNFCGKGAVSEQKRLGALIFAAAHLKRYCEKFGVPLPVDAAHLYDSSQIGDQPGTVIGHAPMAVTSELESNFVGRQTELAELEAHLQEAAAGRGRLITLVGEPGIGKTRTAEELGGLAAQRGAQVLWGRCYEEEGVPPYWPWVQAIRSLIREKDSEKLRSEMGAGAENIAEIVADVRERLPGMGTPPPMEPEQARFRLFDSIATFLKNAAQGQPLMLVLDDLQWADRSSLQLLEFLAREIGSSPLLIVGTYRDGDLSPDHPLAQSLDTLDRRALRRRVTLGGHTRTDVARFIEMIAGLSPPEELVEAVYIQTEGNPLFITEVVRLLMQEGGLTADSGADIESWADRIPDGVRAVIGRRIDRLSDETHEILTIATVGGREFDPKLITPLIDDTSEDRLSGLLQEAMAALVIEELPRGRYQFTHDLFRETMGHGMSPSRKAQIHATIGETLEGLYGDDAGSHAAELAHHFQDAQTAVDKDKLVHYSLLAGEQALAAYAHEEAFAHFERALSAKNGSVNDPGPVSDGDTAAILYGMGHAQLALNRAQDAVPILTRAFDYYVESEDVSRAVAIAQNSHTTTLIIGMRESIAHATQIVPPDSIELGHILANHGYCLGLTPGGYDSSQEAFGHALVIAKDNNDSGLEMRVLANSASIDGFHLRWQTCLAKSLQALELAPGVDDPYPKIRAQQQVYLASLTANGDIERARTYAVAMRSSAERLRDAAWLPRYYFYETNLYCVTGQWSSARQISDEGIARFPTHPVLLGQRALLEHQVGDVTQGEDYLRQFLRYKNTRIRSTGFSTPVVLARISWIMGNGALFDIIQDEAQAIISSLFGIPSTEFLVRCSLAITAVQKGDASSCVDLYPTLVSERGTFAIATDLAVDHILGLLAQTMGNLDQAASHFEDALAFCRDAGYRPELAWTCCDYADTFLTSEEEGDRAKASSLLDESLAISTELGMQPLIERVLARKEILNA